MRHTTRSSGTGQQRNRLSGIQVTRHPSPGLVTRLWGGVSGENQPEQTQADADKIGATLYSDDHPEVERDDDVPSADGNPVTRDSFDDLHDLDASTGLRPEEQAAEDAKSG